MQFAKNSQIIVENSITNSPFPASFFAGSTYQTGPDQLLHADWLPPRWLHQSGFTNYFPF